MGLVEALTGFRRGDVESGRLEDGQIQTTTQILSISLKEKLGDPKVEVFQSLDVAEKKFRGRLIINLSVAQAFLYPGFIMIGLGALASASPQNSSIKPTEALELVLLGGALVRTGIEFFHHSEEAFAGNLSLKGIK